jgi:hypothetical protein
MLTAAFVRSMKGATGLVDVMSTYLVSAKATLAVQQRI